MDTIIHIYYDYMIINPYDSNIYQNPMVDDHVPHSKGPICFGVSYPGVFGTFAESMAKGTNLILMSLTVKTSPMWRFPEIGIPPFIIHL